MQANSGEDRRHQIDPARAVVEVLRAVQRTSISEIDVEWSGGRVHVGREPSVAPAGAATALLAVEGAQTSLIVRSSYVGVFHREPAAQLPAPGDAVAAGQTLAEVETLRIRNAVTAPVDGLLAEVLLENRMPVEYGQPLFVIDPVQDG